MKLPEHCRLNTQILLVLITGVALLLRLPLLNGSFWLDEAAQAIESSRPLANQLDIGYDFQPPLIHFIVHFALQLSHQEWWLRTVAAMVPGVASIILTTVIGEHFFSKKTALLAGLFLATSSLHIFFSQELRPYSLSTLFALCSWYSLIRKKASQWWLPFTLFSLLGLYSSYLYGFLLIGHFFWLYTIRSQEKAQITKSFLAIVLGYLPWLPGLSNQLSEGTKLRSLLPGWESVVGFSSIKAVLLIYGKFLFGVLNIELTPIFLVITTAIFVLIVWGLRIFFSTKDVTPSINKKRPAFLILAWLILPLTLTILINTFIPILQPKRVLFLLPAFYLVIALAIEKIKPKKLRLMAALLVLSINLFSTLEYYKNHNLQRENWRSVYQTVLTTYPQNSAAIFAFTAPFAPWEWYNTAGYPTYATTSLTVTTEGLDDTLKPALQYSRLLLFDYLRDLTDPNDLVTAYLIKNQYTEVTAIDGQSVGFVRVFEKK